MSTQGSASYTIAIGSVAAIIVGGLVLTIVHYPIVNAFMGSAAWSAETADGARMLTFIGGLWEFWGAIILLAIVSFVWIRTRQ